LVEVDRFCSLELRSRQAVGTVVDGQHAPGTLHERGSHRQLADDSGTEYGNDVTVGNLRQLGTEPRARQTPIDSSREDSLS
jgi:hypothetical protein